MYATRYNYNTWRLDFVNQINDLEIVRHALRASKYIDRYHRVDLHERKEIIWAKYGEIQNFTSVISFSIFRGIVS